MKKIYILTAVFALLTLSLNAQMLPNKAVGKESVYLDKGKPAYTSGLFRAPAKINTEDGEFLVGPYTTDYFSTTGIGLYSTVQTSGRIDISAILDRSEIEQYIGQEIVGYRFATTGTVSCYSFIVSTEGPNNWVNDIQVFNLQSSGDYVDVSGTQWHEYYLDEPVTFEIPDSVVSVWIGYKYFQESSSTAGNTYTTTPILVNPNSTSHNTYAYSYANEQYYDVTSTLGGDLAAQLIFKAPTTDPKITASPTSVSMSTTPGETATETVTVTGANLTSGITATISGTDASLFSVSPASLGTSGGDLTITYSPTANGNHTATLTLSSTGAQDVVITLNGTCSSDVTICDGTDTNGYLPIYGFYCDDYQINQMIYPEITSLVGKNITSMTFYATAPLDANLSSVDWNVKLGTTTQTSFASSLASITRLVPDDVTTVAEGYVITSGINTMTITFSTPFTYNGGNLLIDFQSTVEGQYKATDFYGVNQSTYTGYNSYRSSNATPNQNGHYSSGAPRQFLPKVTFTFEDNNKTPKPTITYVVNGDNVVITATGQGTVNLTVGDQTATGNGSASVTVPRTNVDQTVSATATAKDGDKEESDPTIESITVPALPAPELTAPSDGATVNVGTNPGSGVSTTITVSGENLTGDLTISVEGTGFSVEPTTITAAEANAGTTITVTYNGYSSAGTGTLTITSSNGEVEPVTVNLTGNFVPQPIEPVTGLLRLHLLLVDQLKANIPDDNSHADSYRYVLKYEPTGGETKESSPVKVDIHKTECEVKGYYTKAEIDGDTDGALTMDVLTADVEFNLTDDDNTIDFYNLQGKPNEYPALGKDYLTKLQQTTGFVYYEMLEESPNKGDDYPAGLHHYYDDSTPILTGTYTNGFMSYAPSLSTWGVARRYFEDDGLDNTYGAPIWRTRVGKVEIQGKPAMQKQVINAGTSQEANNPHTTWTVGNKTYCLYFLGVNAQGTLPRPYATDYPQGTNIKYEPYMFRVFVSSPTGKLRKFDRVLNPNGGGYEAVDVGPIGPNEKYCVGSFYKNEGWHADDLFFSKTISAQNTTNGFADDGGNDFDPYAWDGIMKFGAEDGISASDVKVWVRMYYMVEGWDATRDGEARPGNGSEGSGDPDDPSTFIYEFDYNAEVVGVTYVNAQGMTSDKPFDGMNIVVTKFSDGTTTTTKVMR